MQELDRVVGTPDSRARHILARLSQCGPAIAALSTSIALWIRPDKELTGAHDLSTVPDANREDIGQGPLRPAQHCAFSLHQAHPLRCGEIRLVMNSVMGSCFELPMQRG